MARRSPYVITLSDADRAELGKRARSYTMAHAEVVRAKIVLQAAGGLENTVIAGRLDVHVSVVSKWRKRFAQEGLGGLADRKRADRPRVFPAPVVAQVKAMACEPPEARQVPLSRWSSADLAAQAVAEGLAESVSASTERRWLAEDAIRPWRYRSWIFPRDPDFAAKAGRVLDLYQRIWEGQELGGDEYVISADEKSQLQVLSRCHPGLPPAPGRAGRVEFEYERGGTVAYFGAYDVHTAHLIGRVEPTTGIKPLTALVKQVMTTEPYASARRVFWVVDNGFSHAGQASVRRMAQAWPTATLVHLPVHASWLNQIEVVFSVIQRKVIKPADFARPRSPHHPAADLHRPLQRHRYPVRLAFHPRRPAPAVRPHRCPPARFPAPARRLTGDTGLMPAPPASTKTSLAQRLRAHARTRWPQLATVEVRFRSQFAYVSGHLPDGQTLPLCRLRYGGSASTWGFAIYRASHDDYQDSILPAGQFAGTPEQALDCACGLYLNDPTAWITARGTDTTTN